MRASVALEEGRATVVRRAHGYSREGSGFGRTDQSRTSAVLGDGGIYSSVDDPRRWLEALDSGRLLPAAELREACNTGTLTSGEPTGYGFGWRLNTWRGQPRRGHTGTSIGFRNVIHGYPAAELSIIILTNRNEGEPARLAERIAEMIPGAIPSGGD